MLQFVWRVEALALPPLCAPCAHCARVSSFLCSERFRVNASGGLLDVWLLYRCAVCGELRKHRIHARQRVGALPRGLLEALQRSDPAEVRRCAFAAARGAEVAYRVVREPWPASGPAAARIVQPEPCGVRWDRLLARELGASRSRLAREVLAGRLCVNGGSELRRIVRDGDELVRRG